MLNTLTAYAEEKGLTVNVGKYQVANRPPEKPVFNLGCQVLKVVEDFKFLGVVFERAGG